MSITILGTDHRYEQHARFVEDRIRRYEPDQLFREGFQDMDPDEIAAEYGAHPAEVEEALDAITELPDAYDAVVDPDAHRPEKPDAIEEGRVHDLHPAVLEHNNVLKDVAERKRSPASTGTYRAVSAAGETGTELYGCDMDLLSFFEGYDPDDIMERLQDPQFNRRREDRMVETIDTEYEGGDALVVLGSTHVDNVAADLERAGYATEKEILSDDHRVRTDPDTYAEYVIGRIRDG